ncbi:MAG: hypothetical protein K9L76_00675 [Candidatus Omnitrophica bacterium]|nr:hypothetical protein [Candidatus Omnitrophota bacterium]
MKGAIFGSIVTMIIGGCISMFKKYINWWSNQRPVNKLLGSLRFNKEPCTFFLRDTYYKDGQLLEVSDRGVGIIQNVMKLWGAVDGKAVSDVFNVLGKAGKNDKISIVELREDHGVWDTNIVCIGAQFPKADDIYTKCNNIYYRMDNENIIRQSDEVVINRKKDYGYGLIMKGNNPFAPGGKGVVLFIGGFGVLGTEAAGYYFRRNYSKLGKTFGDKHFARIVRAHVNLGHQSVEALEDYDITG